MPDANPTHALSFAIPMATPGLKFLCRDSVSVDRAAVRSSVLQPVRRAGCVRHLRQRRDPAGARVHRRQSRCLQRYPAPSWWPNIMQQAMIRARDQADLRLGPRHAHDRGDQCLAAAGTADAGRDLDVRRIRAFRNPRSGGGLRATCGNGVWFPRRTSADRAAHQPAAMVPARERDHPRTWLAQPADHTDGGAIRRSNAATAAG